MKYINFIVLVVCATIIVLTFMSATTRSERAECIKWSNDAHKYEGYYITGWQADQCTTYGIGIQAPIIRQ